MCRHIGEINTEFSIIIYVRQNGIINVSLRIIRKNRKEFFLMNSDNDADILNTIYKNSRMAYDSTKQVAAKCADSELRGYLRRQLNHYADSCRSARRALEGSGQHAQPVPMMQQAMAQSGIFMKTFRDHSASNIAELMYNGTNMGIIDIARSVNRSHNASDDVIKRAEDLMSAEEKYADGLRKFL